MYYNFSRLVSLLAKKAGNNTAITDIVSLFKKNRRLGLNWKV